MGATPFFLSLFPLPPPPPHILILACLRKHLPMNFRGPTIKCTIHAFSSFLLEVTPFESSPPFPCHWPPPPPPLLFSKQKRSWLLLSYLHCHVFQTFHRGIALSFFPVLTPLPSQCIPLSCSTTLSLSLSLSLSYQWSCLLTPYPYPMGVFSSYLLRATHLFPGQAFLPQYPQ